HFQGDATALITVERGGILKTDVLALTSNSAIYDLEITPDMAPNAFVSVTVIKGEDATNFTPAFRTGLIGLNVDTEQLQLNVEVSADRDQAEPQEEVVYTVRVTDFRGQPVQAEIGLALVDEAVLALLPDNLPSLMAYFYSRQGLGVRTANALIYNVDQTTQEIINVQKGGGKGGGDYFGIFTIRKDFITTPLWQPFVVTDLSGVARVRVTLPDQLTTWVLDARAYSLPVGGSETTLVGQAMHSLISTRPLLIRPETPRFYVVGDTSVVSAIVNNNTDEAQDVVAILGAEGGALAGDPTLYATIPAHGRHKFDWPMTVEDSEGVDLVFRVMTTDGRYVDAAKPVTPVGSGGLIPVRRYETPDVTATSGVIGAEGGVRSEGVLVPLPFDDASRISDGDTLRLRVDRSLASGMFDAMRALEIEPYYCIEQVVSRFLPDVVTYQALAARSLDSDEARAAAEALHEQLSAELEAALQRLYNDQHYNGGWGWFIGDQTDQLISAYAVLGLAEARAAGWQIDENVLVQGVTALQRGLKTVDSQTPAWDLNRQAFILYVLARATQANANRVGDLMEPSTIYYDVSRTVSLFNQRDRMNIDARAFLAMTFHIIEPASGYHTQPLMESITRSALISPTGLHWQESFVDAWNWTTDTRTTAIVLKALVETDPSSPQIPDAVRWLMNARRFDRWETTQETAWSVMALSAFTRQTRDALPDYRFDVKLNDEALLTNQRATSDNARQPVTLDVPAAEMERDAVNRLDVQRTPGDGTLYYSAELRTYLPVEEVDALSRGLIVQRVYSLAEDEERTPITQARVGDLIRVTLTIIVPETLNYVAVEDPIPAGTQSVNTSLETTPRLDKDDPLRYGWTSWAFTHVELRDDRTVLYAPYLPRGTYQFIYELRAGAEGDYHVLPARGFAMYRPEVFGRTAGQMFTLLPAEPEPEPSEVYTF
ncbi:MAG: hypothetical protein IT323_20630, partial [Anaerolineae bacterium]|nr:hypothetical protein [Anaerolineae bacterium]